MSHTYLLSWDCTGLEAVVNISNIEKEQMWAALSEKEPNPNKGRPNTVNSIVNMIMMRARVNSQRHYEIYCIDTDDSITTEDFRTMFDEDPQHMADLVRERGRKLYSDRQKDNEIKIR
jgi:cytidylate kinase